MGCRAAEVSTLTLALAQARGAAFLRASGGLAAAAAVAWVFAVDQSGVATTEGELLDLADMSPQSRERLAELFRSFHDNEVGTVRPYGRWSGWLWPSTSAWLSGAAGQWVDGRPLDELDDWQFVRADIAEGGRVHANVPQWAQHGHFGAAPTWPARGQRSVQWSADEWLRQHADRPPVDAHLWSSADPWRDALLAEGRRRGIPVRFFPVAWSSDGYQRCSFGSKRGTERKGYYMWPLQLKDVVDPPVYTMTVTADKDDEAVVARKLVADLGGRPHREMQTTEVRWREPGPWAPRDDEVVVLVGGREAVVFAILLVFFFRKYVSDMPQQMENTGHKGVGGLAASRYTWDHRAQYRDPRVRGIPPVLHHSRLVQGSHRQAAVRLLRVWKATHGWMGLADDWMKMLGLRSLDEPRYGHLPLWIIAVNEAAHLVFNGYLTRGIEWGLGYMMTFDPDLKLFEYLARSLPWGSLCHGSTYWRALKMPQKKKAAGQWQLWVTVLQVLRLGYPLTPDARRQLALLERIVVVVGRAFYVDSHETTRAVLRDFRDAWPEARVLFPADVSSPTFVEMPNLMEVHLYLENCMQNLNGLRGENKHQEGMAGGCRGPCAGVLVLVAPGASARGSQHASLTSLSLFRRAARRAGAHRLGAGTASGTHLAPGPRGDLSTSLAP